VAHAQRYAGRGAVLMIDLDGFKHVNDLMGHRHGDELVQRVGVLMAQVLRETDVVARLGGDEFAVILPEADRSQALMVSEKLLEVLRDRAIVLSESGHASVTGSIGVTAFAADTRLGAEELLVEADIAMYDAKENGRDQTSVFARETHSHGAQRPHVAWLERLQAAIREQRFELLAQPIRGLFPGSRDVFELLLRLRTIDGDLIPPGSFLPDAERFELIQQIDRWVFDRALHILAEQRAAGHDIVLSINMSGKTLGDPNILHDLGALIAECPVEPGRLIVEVTETAAITNIDKARVVARGLRDLGCRFALDDFGAGFASFYYLKHLDFDYLKIDGEFIRNLPQNPTDQLVVRSVVDIARGVGAQTVAEFVADEETVACLRELGVDYGQGYHLGRPQALEQLLAVPR
jgi:diguanylate cyclase (GGDEF)-like protein